jgi:hypothetical protein
VRDGWAAQPINTLSAVSAAAFVVVGLWLWRSKRKVAAALTGAVGLSSAWFHAAPGDAATWAHDLTFYALGLASLIEVRRSLAGRRPPLLAAAVFSAGVVVWFLSRTGGALCNPDSLIQGHALWHVAAAAAVGILFRMDHTIPISDH